MVLFIVWLSQAAGDQDKKYDIFFKQAVDGLAKGSRGDLLGRSGRPGRIDQPPARRRPNSSASGSPSASDTPVPVGTTATIKGVGFTGVSQIQLDPPAPNPKAPGPRPEISCPEDDKSAQCPYGVPVIPTKPGALGELAEQRAGAARAGLDA